VAPGEHDEYYGFLSGGHTGEIRVVGLPSMRELMRIPVFQAESARGFGHDAKSSQMLEEEGGGYTWGDTHHPRVSQTDNDYDGRWLFVNDKANGRMARVDLEYFETDAITNVPNCQGVHGACMQLPDTQLVFGVGEFRVPMPNDGRDVQSPDEYGSVLSAINPETMDVEWQVEVDGNMDNGDGGKEGRWFFATGYNSEEGVTESEMARSDRDYVKAFDIPAIWDAVEAGNYEEISGVPVVDGTMDSSLNEGDRPIVRYVATPKSPHGISVTPDGNYAIASGKLDPSCTVIDIDAIAEVDDPQESIVGQPPDRDGTAPHRLRRAGARVHDPVHRLAGCQVGLRGRRRGRGRLRGAGDREARRTLQSRPPHRLGVVHGVAAGRLPRLAEQALERPVPPRRTDPSGERSAVPHRRRRRRDGADDQDKPSYPEPHDASIVHKDKIEPAKTWDTDDYGSTTSPRARSPSNGSTTAPSRSRCGRAATSTPPGGHAAGGRRGDAPDLQRRDHERRDPLDRDPGVRHQPRVSAPGHP